MHRRGGKLLEVVQEKASKEVLMCFAGFLAFVQQSTEQSNKCCLATASCFPFEALATEI